MTALRLRRWYQILAVVLAVALSSPLAGPLRPASAASPEEIEAKLKALQEQVDGLRRELEQSKAQRQAAPAPAAPAAQSGPSAPAGAQPVVATPAPPAERPSLLTDFKIGGYGSTRFEASDLDRLNNTFTYRRFVLAGDARIGDRLRSVVELELERLTELEVERTAP